MLLSRALAATAVAVALAGCGFTKSPAEGLTFKPPDGWASTPGVMGRFQLWTSPGGSEDKQVLMLLKLPATAKLDAAEFSANAGSGSPLTITDETVIQRRSLTICSNQPAVYSKMRGKSSKSNDEETVETVISRSSDAAYLAMYVYPVTASPDTAVEASLFDLCPAK